VIALALDTATDRCTVAAGDGERVAHRFLDGSRLHAGAIVGLVDAVLDELGVTAAAIGRVLVADGPGSFTGLRVAASVGKALAWHRQVEWQVAPSLLVRALGNAPANGGNVLALSDALRGELYAGSWRITSAGVARTSLSPRAMTPESLAGLPSPDVVVGSIPAQLVAAVAAATGCVPVTGEAALPDARMLLRLAGIPGGTMLVAEPASWQPDYGRPVEAQAAWERAHGVEMPNAPGVPR
jgi:tRNA threonylcarbamoyladenosine biosynthesis protein TsaB